MPAVSMLDKSGFYWLEARFVFYKIATVWRNLELILHSSSLQRSLQPSKTHKSPEKKGPLRKQEKDHLKKTTNFSGCSDFLYSSWGM